MSLPQPPTSVTRTWLKGTFGETLSCLPMTHGSHCFHTPATLLPRGRALMLGWGSKESSVLFVCRCAPLPIPRVQGFPLPGDQVSGKGHWMPRKRKKYLKIPLPTHFGNSESCGWERDINLLTSPRGRHEYFGMTGNSRLQRDIVKSWGQGKGNLRVFGAYRLCMNCSPHLHWSKPFECQRT